MKVIKEVFLTLRLNPDDAEELADAIKDINNDLADVPDVLLQIKNECDAFVKENS
jgi:hypothetical protein